MNVYDSDYQILLRFFEKTGWTVAVREIVHKACRKLEERENQVTEFIDE